MSTKKELRLAVLRCLVNQAGQLVTKDALLMTVWPKTAVSESALTGAIRQLRRVLGNQARTPQFIRRCTVGGIGSMPRLRWRSRFLRDTRPRGCCAYLYLSPASVLRSFRA